MLELSVERALYQSDGIKRPVDRLVYRYIENFLRLICIFLMKFTSGEGMMSKHEVLAQVLDAIHQAIDDDHNKRKRDFNQKPYYRILISILRIVNNPSTFNPKTHL